mgnify:CR=1 FL=1|uniref:Glycosyltransferase n=1 Tax=Anaerolinea thermolimosa TaxID=229919 RepID=A0A7C4PL99_9CHLR
MRKTLLICYTKLAHYRVPVFERLGLYYDLWVVHSGKQLTPGDAGFKEIILPGTRIGPFFYQPGLWSLIRDGKFDAVIFFLDLAWLSISLSFFLNRGAYKRITWGLWRTGLRIANYVRLRAALHADANVFYSEGAAADFINFGVPADKIWVARNTVYVERPERAEETLRDSLLFIGSFDYRKRNDMAVRAFYDIIGQLPPHIKLVFVGDGPAKRSTQLLARNIDDPGRIEFHPGTTDPSLIRQFYSKAIASFSFGQAGLSVLQSLGHGVPFITCLDAISGGEIENLRHHYNAILCGDDINDLKNAFLKVCLSSDLASKLGQNALEHYKALCTVDRMVAGFRGAIESIPHSGFSLLSNKIK